VLLFFGGMLASVELGKGDYGFSRRPSGGIEEATGFSTFLICTSSFGSSSPRASTGGLGAAIEGKGLTSGREGLTILLSSSPIWILRCCFLPSE